ncbi:Methyltransferase domain protein [Lactobacillus helsingborgensis]|uniref:Methyltransferase n=1 Tax=Lactobacillus helsingborgensis TaxID=1218494 RepID=A0AA47GGG1_9LACO|nr:MULTISPECIES: methyltransferase [Lactobacillus]AIS09571.1 Ribosomal RNA small subunit methyltransferase C [Lactobacillus sp. wkB8]KJY64039.1 Methyltransferase domain protein [Lactobacillus helsingborgensis]UZX29184.1 methyltransferase [Lactobacillus helsingborgensis]
MTEQNNQMYYAENPTSQHDEHVVDYRVNDIDLKFTTDAGVFSKMRVDYGSGVLIKKMPDVNFPSNNILDVGTGYGPLGLFAAKFWPTQTVEMVDVNQRGLDLAKKNAELNHIDNVAIFVSDVYSNIAPEKKYGLIVTNPPIRAGKTVVSNILSGAKSHLVGGGVLLVVIQKKQGEPSARKLLTKTFGNCTILKRDKGYYVLQAVNN